MELREIIYHYAGRELEVRKESGCTQVIRENRHTQSQ